MPTSVLARRAVSVLVLAAAATLLRPSSALAHAGLTAPAATSYLAKIARVPPGVEAKVVDGDQQLWLRADPRLTLVVTGLRGEPYLRFSPDGVWVNKRSPTFYLNATRPQVPPRGAVPGATPNWRRVSTGHSYRWHEDRLHALAVTSRPGGASYVGTWAVPLAVGGKPARITGGLWHAANPSILWFWPIVVLAACCGAFLRLRRPRVDRMLAASLSLATLAAMLVARAGRGFYGRPTVSSGQLIEFGIYAAFALAGLCLVLLPEWRDGAVAIAAFVGLDVGLGLVSVLTRGFVLSAFPAALERIAVSATLAGCVSCLLVLIVGDTSTREPRREKRGRPRPRPAQT